MKLKHLLIKSKKSIFSAYHGSKEISLLGEGSDFRELREYVYGDDVRHIDWKATAKRDGKPYIKVFDTAKSVELEIIYLINGSLNFGTTRLKSEVMLETGALLSYNAIKQSYRLTETIFSKKLELRSSIKDVKEVDDFLAKLDSFKPLKHTVDYNALFKYLNMQKGRKMFVLVGDFFTMENFLSLNRKHEVVSLIIRDKLEENLKGFGDISLIDPTNLDHYSGLITSFMSKKYNGYVNNLNINLYKNLNKNGIKYLKIFTDDDIYKSMLRVFV